MGCGQLEECALSCMRSEGDWSSTVRMGDGFPEWFN